jgi:hypothetical protein
MLLEIACLTRVNNRLANVFLDDNFAVISQLPPGMSDKQHDRLKQLWQAAGESLSDDDVEMLKEEQGLLIENKLLSRSAIEQSTVEQLRDSGIPLGTALLLKKAFPSKLSEWSCIASPSPCIAPSMSVTV